MSTNTLFAEIKAIADAPDGSLVPVRNPSAVHDMPEIMRLFRAVRDVLDDRGVWSEDDPDHEEINFAVLDELESAYGAIGNE